MKKILIEISNTSLSFSYCAPAASNSPFSSITENGVNRIITTEDYIHKKYELFITFLQQTNEKNNINMLILSDYDLFDLVFHLTCEIFKFDTVIFKPMANLPQNIFDLIMDNEFKMKNLKCYSMAKEMYDSLIDKEINVDIESTLFFNSRLFSHNNFQTYEDLTDKEIIEFDFNPDEYDYADFNNFLKSNEKLHTIDIKKYYPHILDNIINILKENNKDDIAINIYGDAFKYEEEIKQKAKECRHNFYITVVYSDELRHTRNKQIITAISFFIIPLILISLIIYLLT